MVYDERYLPLAFQSDIGKMVKYTGFQIEQIYIDWDNSLGRVLIIDWNANGNNFRSRIKIDVDGTR